jgi:hypothetical protein
MSKGPATPCDRAVAERDLAEAEVKRRGNSGLRVISTAKTRPQSSFIEGNSLLGPYFARAQGKLWNAVLKDIQYGCKVGWIR